MDIVVLLPSTGDFSKILAENEVPYFVSPFANTAYTLRDPNFWTYPFVWLRDRFTRSRLLEKVQAIQADIIYTNSSVTSIGFWLSKQLNKPHVWHIREYGWLGLRLIFFGGKQKLIKQLNQSSQIISISKALKKEVLSEVTAPIKVIYNGVMTMEEMKHIPSHKDQNKSRFNFLILGLIHPTKNQLEAIDAFALIASQHPNIHLTIVGGGRASYLRKLKKRVESLKLENRITFTGYQANPSAYFLDADAFLMCTKYEGMGRVTAEAMAYCLPVIGLAMGATPELVIDQKTGLLYTDGAKDLAQKMTYLITHPKEAKRMGEQGREFAISTFNNERYTTQVKELLEELG